VILAKYKPANCVIVHANLRRLPCASYPPFRCPPPDTEKLEAEGSETPRSRAWIEKGCCREGGAGLVNIEAMLGRLRTGVEGEERAASRGDRGGGRVPRSTERDIHTPFTPCWNSALDETGVRRGEESANPIDATLVAGVTGGAAIGASKTDRGQSLDFLRGGMSVAFLEKKPPN